MDFEASFRMFLESFRLPGEAQKIARVMEAFGAEYFRQCPDVFHDPDVVYVLAYSTILLNTDQHNPMVRAVRLKTVQDLVVARPCKSLAERLAGKVIMTYKPVSDGRVNAAAISAHLLIKNLVIRAGEEEDDLR